MPAAPAFDEINWDRLARLPTPRVGGLETLCFAMGFWGTRYGRLCHIDVTYSCGAARVTAPGLPEGSFTPSTVGLVVN